MIKIGIVGCGLIAYSHAKGIAECGRDCKIVAICDSDPKKMERYTSDLNLSGVKQYTDYRELMKQEDVDAVSVCTPNDVHMNVLKCAAEAGKNVLCEKPLGLHASEVRAMADVCEKNHVINMTGFSYRRIPAVAEIKTLLDTKLLGRVYHYRARFYADRMAAVDHEIEWRHREKEAGSGVLGDLASHLLDMGLFLLEGQCSEVRDVYADAAIYVPERRNLETGKMEKVTTDDSCDIIAHFTDGTEMILETSRYAPFEVELHINGEKGSIRYNLNRYDEFELMLYDSPANYFRTYQTVHVPAPMDGLKTGPTDRMTRQYQYFIDCINRREEAHPNIRETVYIQELLDCMKLSYQDEEKKLLLMPES